MCIHDCNNYKAKWGELSNGACSHSKFFPTLTNCLETIFVVVASFPAIFILSFCLQKKSHSFSAKLKNHHKICT